MTEIVAPELRTPFGIMTQVERDEIMLMVIKIPSEMEVALRYTQFTLLTLLTLLVLHSQTALHC